MEIASKKLKDALATILGEAQDSWHLQSYRRNHGRVTASRQTEKTVDTRH